MKRKIIGYLMLTAFTVALYFAIAIEAGFISAAVVMLVSALLAAFIIKGIDLIS